MVKPKIYSVYKITNNINGKSYIGFTGNTIFERFEQHKKDALKIRDNRKFYNAINKYGVDVWEIKLLETLDNADFAKQKEIKFIEKFDTYNAGYNSTKGGDGNNGIIMTEESNLKRSKALKGIPKNYTRMHGKTHSEESKKKISESHKGKKKPWVKWEKSIIEKRAMTRRGLTEQQYNLIHELTKEGLTSREISEKINLSNDMVKKWRLKDWNFS
jgi:group I intron endonuclease